MSKQFIAVIVVIILIFVGIFAFGGKKSSTTASSGSSSTPTSHYIGSKSTGVVLTEYGDYECPYCEEYFPTIKSVQTEFASQIQFQFRNFPLVNIHQNAFAGARAAEAAGLMGKFWEMHDALYDSANWQQWSTAADPTPFFKQYAASLGLNAATFQTDYASSQVNDLINADTAAGNKLDIQGTPSFFLDGKQVQVANTVAAFEKVIKAEIAKKDPSATSTSSTSTTSAAPASASNETTTTNTPATSSTGSEPTPTTSQ